MRFRMSSPMDFYFPFSQFSMEPLRPRLVYEMSIPLINETIITGNKKRVEWNDYSYFLVC
jgi:hypothetical protein